MICNDHLLYVYHVHVNHLLHFDNCFYLMVPVKMEQPGIAQYLFTDEYVNIYIHK